MTPKQQHKRRFLVAALNLAGASLVLGPSILGAARVWAAAAAGAPAHAALTRVARLLYPHQALEDSVYAEVLDQAMAQVADDSRFGQLLRDAEAALDGRVAASFMEADSEAQLAALRTIDGADYFAAIQYAVAVNLYSHPQAWAMMGYEGASWQHGGWLERGAGKVDWLPGENP